MNAANFARKSLGIDGGIENFKIIASSISLAKIVDKKYSPTQRIKLGRSRFFNFENHTTLGTILTELGRNRNIGIASIISSERSGKKKEKYFDKRESNIPILTDTPGPDFCDKRRRRLREKIFFLFLQESEEKIKKLDGGGGSRLEEMAWRCLARIGTEPQFACATANCVIDGDAAAGGAIGWEILRKIQDSEE